MIRGERGESDVLTEGARDHRPVVGQGDLGPGRPGRSQIVAPDPAAEPQAAVAGFLTRLPGDGAIGSVRTAKMAFTGALMIMVALTVASAMVVAS
jgi:hypothetical protein